MPLIATFEIDREAPSGQAFGAIIVEAGCVVLRSRDEKRAFPAILLPGITLSGSEVRLGGGRGAAALRSDMMFVEGPLPKAGANVGPCSGDHMVLTAISGE